jgi:hypothetical protein
MRLSIIAAFLATSLVGACMGPDGNPDKQPYANEADGAIAQKPQFLGTESYDPYGKPADFADMDVGNPAINPSPASNPAPTYTPANASKTSPAR